MNVILLASAQPRVGKSTLTKKLLQNIPQSAPLSFALPIKEICYNLHSDIVSRFGQAPTFTFDEYIQTKKDVAMEGIFTTSPRHQYCEGSEFISKLTSANIWGDLALYRLTEMSKNYINTAIIDDWRRMIELNILKTNKDLNCVTVYLDKDGIEEYKGTEATESFEGQIKPEDCDYTFKFKSDWSNEDEIINLLQEAVGVSDGQ